MANHIIIGKELKRYVRKNAKEYLSKYNVNSIGIGLKIKDNKKTNELSIQFTVGQKFELETLKQKSIYKIPETIEVGNKSYPTDVLERDYETKIRRVNLKSKLEEASYRKAYANPIMPGISISNNKLSAGTVGCVVYDAITSQQYILSNWHVLHGLEGEIGDYIVQPGPYDDNRINDNVAGVLERSHLGIAGDCAIASIENRNLESGILELGTQVNRIADAMLGDKVIKSGRTTGVTYGVVSRVDVTVELNYGSKREPFYENIGCIEIEPDPHNFPEDGEISMGGDSGSVWMLRDEINDVTDIMLGLHFAGESGNAPEHALACYPGSVFEKLSITPTPYPILESKITKSGFMKLFHSEKLFLPKAINVDIQNDYYLLNENHVIDYTHFSLALSKSRKLARWVAWNIDGSNMKKVSSNSSYFDKDPRISDEFQIGNELYKGNDLDRGHIARRADLIWGSHQEAVQANKDSYNYTNIAPQHEKFNRSNAAGIWGKIENAIYSDLTVKQLKVSVIAGPIFEKDDPVFEGVQIPVSYWKVIYYENESSSKLQARAYVVTQIDLISQLEKVKLEDYEVYQISINELQSLISLDIPNKKEIGSKKESLEVTVNIRKVESSDEIINY